MWFRGIIFRKKKKKVESRKENRTPFELNLGKFNLEPRGRGEQ